MSEDHQYSTIKYFFIYDKAHKIYRMKKGPNGRSLITLAQFLEVDSITRLLDPTSGIIDSLVYYDTPGAARKEITEEKALVNSNTEDPDNKPTPTRPATVTRLDEANETPANSCRTVRMATLADKAECLRAELGLEKGAIVDIIKQASTQLGLDAELRGMPVMNQADACLAQMGSSVTIATPVTPQGGVLAPSPEQIHRGGEALLSAERLQGCWVGSVLGILPWAASLEPQGPDAYTRTFQCCSLMPNNCGNRYERVGQTNTFRATDEDIETFMTERCTTFSPTPGQGFRIC